MDSKNKYTLMQEAQYRAGTSNHQEHNENPDYWKLLIPSNVDYSNKLGLDFGCGKGRNVTNLIEHCNFERVDGVDISSGNINECKVKLPNSKFYNNNGVDLSDIKSETYDFIMSTIVLQHIPVYDIRLSILKEIYRVMKKGGIFNFQMGYGKDLKNPNGNDRIAYYDNHYNASGTNGILDVRVTNEDDLVKDLNNIGFKVINLEINDSFSDIGHPNWIYISCKK